MSTDNNRDREIRVLIADDHPIFRRGLRLVIEGEPGLTVVAEVADGLDALSAVRSQQPEIAVLDVDMPGLDGFAIARAIEQEQLPTRVLFLTMHKEEDMLHEALRLKVQGYVVKDSAVTEIVGGIRAVMAGGSFISPALSNEMVARIRQNAELLTAKPNSLQELTPSERQILKLIAEHKTNKEIAGALFISHRTVENHRANICQKLDLRGTHALLRFALDHKFQLL